MRDIFRILVMAACQIQRTNWFVWNTLDMPKKYLNLTSCFTLNWKKNPLKLLENRILLQEQNLLFFSHSRELFYVNSSIFAMALQSVRLTTCTAEHFLPALYHLKIEASQLDRVPTQTNWIILNIWSFINIRIKVKWMWPKKSALLQT